MNIITKTTSVAVLVALSLAFVMQAAEPPQTEAPADLDKFVGQPVDMSPWAYAWRADRQVQEKPEAYFIPHRLKRLDTVYRTVESRLTETERGKWGDKGVKDYSDLLPAPKGGLLSALLWLAPVPTQRIELRWPEGSAIPPAEAIEVRVYPSEVGWFGVVRDEILPAPAVSENGRTLTYLNQQPEGNNQGKPIFKGTDMVPGSRNTATMSVPLKIGFP